MKRGEIWTITGPGYARKPRPAVIVQDDHFATESVTLCLFTTDETDAPLFRILVEPDGHNGLRQSCRMMADKVMTVPRRRLGSPIGYLARADLIRLNRALVVFLGIAS